MPRGCLSVNNILPATSSFSTSSGVPCSRAKTSVSMPSLGVGALHMTTEHGTSRRSARTCADSFGLTISKVASPTSQANGDIQFPNSVSPFAGCSTNSTLESSLLFITSTQYRAPSKILGKVNHRSLFHTSLVYSIAFALLNSGSISSMIFLNISSSVSESCSYHFRYFFTSINPS